MALVDLKLRIGRSGVPPEVRRLLRSAERRIDRFRQSARINGFVPSDFERAYEVLHALSTAPQTRGRLFCEWGSGFGVVACLAAMLEFDACGIEIEPELVAVAQQLADDFDLPVEFSQGSFIPRAALPALARQGFAWLAVEADCRPAELGPDDFDVIFAYPWPDEEQLIADLFERFAAVGAILVTYHGSDDFRLRRKTRDTALPLGGAAKVGMEKHLAKVGPPAFRTLPRRHRQRRLVHQAAQEIRLGHELGVYEGAR